MIKNKDPRTCWARWAYRSSSDGATSRPVQIRINLSRNTSWNDCRTVCYYKRLHCLIWTFLRQVLLWPSCHQNQFDLFLFILYDKNACLLSDNNTPLKYLKIIITSHDTLMWMSKIVIKWFQRKMITTEISTAKQSLYLLHTINAKKGVTKRLSYW
jgi:hypothetical protein